MNVLFLKGELICRGTTNNELITNNVSICSKLNSVIKDIYNNPVPSLFEGIGLAFFGGDLQQQPCWIWHHGCGCYLSNCIYNKLINQRY